MKSSFCNKPVMLLSSALNEFRLLLLVTPFFYKATNLGPLDYERALFFVRYLANICFFSSALRFAKTSLCEDTIP